MLIKVNNKFPEFEKDSYIAPSSSVIGDGCLGSLSSVWFGAVIRADKEREQISKIIVFFILTKDPLSGIM